MPVPRHKPIKFYASISAETFKRLQKPRKTRPVIKGKTIPLGILAFISVAFEANELRFLRRGVHPWTDHEIAAMIAKEYPHFNFATTVNGYRQKHNRWELRNTPLICSFRYNVEGKRVNGRTGNHLLQSPEVAATVLKFEERKAAIQRKATTARNYEDARRIELSRDRSGETGGHGPDIPQDAHVCPCCGQRLQPERQDAS